MGGASSPANGTRIHSAGREKRWNGHSHALSHIGPDGTAGRNWVVPDHLLRMSILTKPTITTLKQPKASKNSINHSFCEVNNCEHWAPFLRKRCRLGNARICLAWQSAGDRTLVRPWPNMFRGLARDKIWDPIWMISESNQSGRHMITLTISDYTVKSEQNHFVNTFCSNQIHKFHRISPSTTITTDIFGIRTEPLLCSQQNLSKSE